MEWPEVASVRGQDGAGRVRAQDLPRFYLPAVSALQAFECQQDQLHPARRLPRPAEPLSALPVRQQDPESCQGDLHLPAGHPDTVSTLSSSFSPSTGVGWGGAYNLGV